MIYVPAKFAPSAIIEAIENEISLIVCITEGIPVHDMIKIKKIAKLNNITLIGPNCPGIITPGSAKAGIMPVDIFKKGTIGMLSRSGTLLYEATDQIVKKGFGISTAIGIGGDPIIGSDYVDWLEKFEKDSETEAVVLIGEIGGDAEERAAKFIKTKMTKPVVAFIAGRTAPQGKRMGHAGAIISGNSGTVESKDKAFYEANVLVAKQLSQIGETLKKRLKY
jgi:succinyl-CoA synthetase alpha subunit